MIEFQSLEYKNIMAVGNSPIKIDLSRSPTTVIGGQNGSGKSTILLAFAYCFFGKVINGMKLGQAINSINKKKLLVTGTFKKNGDDWTVIRGDKPKRFEIYKNGDMIDQYANVRDQQKFLELILGMDYKLFTQVILLNKERYVPFMEMGAADRRKIIEDILGISIFTEMNEVVKAKITEKKREEANVDRDREVKKTELEGQKNLVAQLQTSIAESSKQSEDELKELQAQLDSANDSILRIEDELRKLSTEGWSKVQKQLREYGKLADQFSSKIDDSKRMVKFFESNSHCPTCGQDIDDDLKHKKQCESETKISEVEATISDMMVELQKVKEQDDDFKERDERANELMAEKSNFIFQKKQLEKEIDRVMNRSKRSSEHDKLQECINHRDGLETELETLSERLRVVIDERVMLEELRILLKDDGVKALIVREYNSVMNKKINDYLASMDFYVNMTIDENFKEKFHSMGRDGFTYENLSSGQKMRVNIAITLALLEVAAMKNSVVTNVLFLDEILEPIDAEGIKDIMNLFKDRLASKNIFVITQRFDEFEDQFQSAIKFKLNGGFTELVV